MVGDRLMGISDERVRNCVCLNIYNRIDSMRMPGGLIIMDRAKSLVVPSFLWGPG
jgi:hypothetical protein